MFLIMFAATTAGFLSMVVTASTSVLLALIVGPLVGSAAALGAGLFLAWRRGSTWKSNYDLDHQADQMVGALRALAEQGRAVDVAPTVQTAKSSRAA